MRGCLITFEGGEGAGKSTQVKRLARRLEQKGIAAVRTREPGGSPRAETIRSALLSGAVERHGPLAEALMFAAARADHVEHTIRPALERGAYVLCDRFVDSTRVYQGTLGRIDRSLLSALERVAVQTIRPNLTLVLDVPAKLGLSRAALRRQTRREAVDRFETEGAAYHDRVREAFLAIAREEPERCVVLEATGDPDEVERLIWSAVEERILAPQRPESPERREEAAVDGR